ncbi:MAG TPA: formate dehydrogenase accessory sulfurtransferase FdhD [Chloroflexota bacterium]|nr:formate dehydrogenase accessory sulfurtransferase FdhD [Chloroflexota bacterium]
MIAISLKRDEAPAEERAARQTVAARTIAWKDDRAVTRSDVLAVEEPLEIRLAGCRVAVTMRTPGDDFDLALGFLLTEGIIRSGDDVASIAHCPAEPDEVEGNIVNVNPADPGLVDPERWRRNFYATSSCGICGKASIELIRQQAAPIDSDLRVSSDLLFAGERALRSAQTVFGQTGGLHAAALISREGVLIALREDVGRHNAVDKVIGAMLRDGRLPLRDSVLMVSSRASFEVIQKALVAGVPLVAAMSAPSSLAVELARESGMSLVGFLRSESERGGRFNIYAGSDRIDG